MFFFPLRTTSLILIRFQKWDTTRATGQTSVLIPLDLSAVFDAVNHCILLNVIDDIGISGKAHYWGSAGPGSAQGFSPRARFFFFLTGYSFSVSWHEQTSSPPDVFSYLCYADDTQLSFLTDDYTIVLQITPSLSVISSWMKKHHLPLNLSKTELLVILATLPVYHIFPHLGWWGTLVSWLVICCPDYIAVIFHSCCFVLYNIQEMRPCLTQNVAQLLVQATVICCLDNGMCFEMLTDDPECSGGTGF